MLIGSPGLGVQQFICCFGRDSRLPLQNTERQLIAVLNVATMPDASQCRVVSDDSYRGSFNLPRRGGIFARGNPRWTSGIEGSNGRKSLQQTFNLRKLQR